MAKEDGIGCYSKQGTLVWVGSQDDIVAAAIVKMVLGS